MKIAFDLDDILAGFQAVWIAHNNKHYGTHLTYNDLINFHYSKFMNIENDEVMRRIFEIYDDPIFKTIIPVEGAIEAVNKVKAGKHELSVITARVEALRTASEEWVEQYFKDVFQHIYFTGQVASKDAKTFNLTKADVCLKEGIELLVEDAPHYAEAVAEAGIDVAYISKPWNVAFNLDHPKVHRLKDIGEVAGLIETLTVH